MFVLEVIPLAKNLPEGTLSYRHTRELPPGSLVEVPLRRARVPGLVVSSQSARDAKAFLKRAGFALRGGALTELGALPNALVEAADGIAKHHASSLGAVLSALMRDFASTDAAPLEGGPGFRETTLEAAYEKRLAAYERAIASANADGRAALLIAPTLAEADRLAEALSRFLPLLLTGEIPAKKREKIVKEACASTGLIVATPAFLWLPVARLGFLALERAGAGSFMREQRPYLDLRIAARELAKARTVPLILADALLPLALRPKPDATAALPGLARTRIIDARTEDSDDGERRPFKAIPDSVMAEIGATLGEGGRVAVLAVRKGYAPSVVCRDCGTTVRDEFGNTLAFVKSGKGPVFRSADGKTVRAADTQCRACESWNLLPLGIGVERLTDELAAALPEFPRVSLDPASARSKKARTVLLKKSAEPGTLLIGTESMLAFLDPSMPLERIVIASADSLLALPFWSARERLVRLGLSARERAVDLSILTRYPDETAFDAIRAPEEPSFWREEAMLREKLEYPPYAHLLSFHAEGSSRVLEAASREIARATSGLTLMRLPDRQVSPSRLRLSIVAKVPAKSWPDKKIARDIALLPPSVEVRIDPDSLW